MRIVASQLYFFCLALSVFTIPFGRDANNFALLLVIIFWLLQGGLSDKLKAFFKNPPAFLCAVLFLLYSIGLLYSDHPQLGLKVLEKRSSLIILPVVFSGIVQLPKDRRNNLIWCFVASIGIASLISLLIGLGFTTATGTVYHIRADDLVIEHNFYYHRLASYIDIHAAYFALYNAFCFMVVLVYLLEKSSGFSTAKKLMIWLLIMFFLSMVYLLQSASIIFALLIVGPAVVIYWFTERIKPTSKQKVIFGIMMLAILIAAWLVGENKIGIDENFFRYNISEMPPGNWNALNLRLAKWEITGQLLKDHWLIGVGTGDMHAVLQQYYLENEFYFGFWERFNPHNQFLQTFVTLGLPGLGCLLLIYFLGFKRAIRSRDFTFITFMAIFTVFSLTESTLAINKGLIFFVIFLMLFTYSDMMVNKEAS